SPTPSSGGASRRLHGQYNGTTARHVWVDGDLKVTDNTIIARSGDTLVVGAGWTTVTSSFTLESFIGSLWRIYLRLGIMSADWLAAEFASWESPSDFYMVAGPAAGA